MHACSKLKFRRNWWPLDQPVWISRPLNVTLIFFNQGWGRVGPLPLLQLFWMQEVKRSRLTVLSTDTSLAPSQTLLFQLLLVSLDHLLFTVELLLAGRFGLWPLVEAVRGVVLGKIHLLVLAVGRPGGAGGDPTVGGGHLGVGVGSRFFGSGDSTVDKDKGPFINITSFLVFHTKVTVNIGLKEVVRMVTFILLIRCLCFKPEGIRIFL